MTGPDDRPPSPARAVIPLDYGGRSGDGEWTVVRFVATFLIVQGVTVAASSAWSAVRLGLQLSIPGDGVATAVELVKAGTGLGLVAGGWLARRRRRGPVCCVTFEAALAVAFVAETAIWVWQLSRNGYAGREWVLWGGDYALQMLVELVMPVFALSFFRRANVRAAVRG